MYENVLVHNDGYTEKNKQFHVQVITHFRKYLKLLKSFSIKLYHNLVVCFFFVLPNGSSGNLSENGFFLFLFFLQHEEINTNKSQSIIILHIL